MTVVDASVWVSRFLSDDVRHALSRDWLEWHFAAAGIVVAPALLLAEVSGAIARRTGRPELAGAAVQHLIRVPGLRLVPVDRGLAKAGADAARDLGLRGADALYVATARRLSLRLVTWDAEQLRRGSALIEVLNPATGEPS